MKQPTIDRKNNDDNYELYNCQFIEQSENSRKRNELRIFQYDLEGNFIKEYSNITSASRKLNCSVSNIAGALKCRQKTAKGFIWRYKYEEAIC